LATTISTGPTTLLSSIGLIQLGARLTAVVLTVGVAAVTTSRT